MDIWQDTTGESRERWERISACWDSRMGDDGNRHSLELIFPETERLLDTKKGEKILDAACGNGTFSRRLAAAGCRVLAFDYSEAMIGFAMERSIHFRDLIDYRVIDATDIDALLALGTGTFDKAVCNMAIHDISSIDPLFRGVYGLLKPGGVFVFSSMHPCYKNAGMQNVVETAENEAGVSEMHAVKIYSYITPQSYYGYAISAQPVAHRYYHRPISAILNAAFAAGFAVTGIAEPVFHAATVEKGDWTEIPAVMIIRAVKPKGGEYQP